MRNRTKKRYFDFFILCSCIFFVSCTVGLNTKIKANTLSAPVSFSETMYTNKMQIADSTKFQRINSFSFEFTKWGISTPLNIGSDKDISRELNQIITKNGGDAILDLKISVKNSGVNYFLLVPKVLSLWTGVVAISLLASGESADNAIVAASSVIIYLFTPAKANIKVQGVVVKLE